MTIQDRKERERDEKRELILSAANQIVAEEGIDNLSVRKIARKIEYSPAIIYHYFKDKDDIVNHLMKGGYQRIVDALTAIQGDSYGPEDKIRVLNRKVIELALEIPDEYMTIMTNTSPRVLAHTASLFKGASSKKQALSILFQCLKDIYKDKNMDDDTIELTAQVIWAATFGLIIRLIMERDIEEEQKQKLIDHHIKCTVDGIVLGKSLYNC